MRLALLPRQAVPLTEENNVESRPNVKKLNKETTIEIKEFIAQDRGLYEDFIQERQQRLATEACKGDAAHYADANKKFHDMSCDAANLAGILETHTIGAALGAGRKFSPLASNRYARDHFFEALQLGLSDVVQKKTTKLYEIRISDPRWALSKHELSFDMKSMTSRVKRSLREIGYHAVLFMMVERSISFNEKGYFQPQLHGFVWPKKKKAIEPSAAEMLLAKRFGKKDHQDHVRFERVKPRDDRELELLFARAIAFPKSQIVPLLNEDIPGFDLMLEVGSVMSAKSKNLSENDALQISAILAQYEIDDTVIAVGDGTKLRKLGKKAIDAKSKASKHLSIPTGKRVRKLVAKAL